MNFDFLNRKKKAREAEEQARIEEARKREEREREEREREEREREEREREEREREEREREAREREDQERLKRIEATTQVSKLAEMIPPITNGDGVHWRTNLRSIAHDIRKRMNEYCATECAYIDSHATYSFRHVCEFLDKKTCGDANQSL